MPFDGVTSTRPEHTHGASAEDLGSPNCPVCRSRQTLEGGSLTGPNGQEYELRVCAQCGLASLNVPDQSVLEACYGGEYFSQNAALNPSYRARIKSHMELSESPFAHKALRALTIGWLPRPGAENSRMLDVGCGDGAAMERARNLGWNAEGCEVDDTACARARARGFKCYSRDWWRKLPTDSYNLVLMNHVLEHLPDPLVALSGVRASMTSDGKLLLGLPNNDSAWASVFGTLWWAHCPPQHLWHFKVSHIERLLAHCGLQIEGVRVRNVLLDVLSPGAQWTAVRAAGWNARRFLSAYYSAASRSTLDRALGRGPIVGEGCVYTLECRALDAEQGPGRDTFNTG